LEDLRNLRGAAAPVAPLNPALGISKLYGFFKYLIKVKNINYLTILFDFVGFSWPLLYRIC
jgi:hypothetical protein